MKQYLHIGYVLTKLTVYSIGSLGIWPQDGNLPRTLGSTNNPRATVENYTMDTSVVGHKFKSMMCVIISMKSSDILTSASVNRSALCSVENVML